MPEHKMPDPEALAAASAQASASLEDIFCNCLEGKAALVTGGASGLGYAVVNRLAQAGAKVVIACRTAERGEKAVADFTARGFDVSYVSCDITKVEDCAKAVEFTEKTYGQLDILVADAAVWDAYAYLDVPEEVFDKVVDTDLKGAFFCGQAAARSMVANKVKGKIVFISSAAYKGEGMMGIGFNTYYIAAKAGVQAMTKGIAAELRQYGIGVNCVAPGGMLSHGVFVQGNKGSQMYGPDFDEVAGAHRGQTPLAMNPDQVALAVFALCTPMSDFMCGTTIDVDGGVLMNIQEKPFSFTIEGCVPGPKAE